jgi:hypothetical protein
MSDGVTTDLANHATQQCVDAINRVVDLCDRKQRSALVAMITSNILDAASGILAAEYMIATGKPQPPYADMVLALYQVVGEEIDMKIKARAEDKR